MSLSLLHTTSRALPENHSKDDGNAFICTSNYDSMVICWSSLNCAICGV